MPAIKLTRPNLIIGATSAKNIGPAWQQLLETRDRELEFCVFAEYGLGEEVISLLAYEGDFYEVIIGESLRPVDIRYEGSDHEKASKIFLETVVKHSL